MPSEPPAPDFADITFTKVESVVRYQVNQDLLDILFILDQVTIGMSPDNEVKRMIYSMRDAVLLRDI